MKTLKDVLDMIGVNEDKLIKDFGDTFTVNLREDTMPDTYDKLEEEMLEYSLEDLEYEDWYMFIFDIETNGGDGTTYYVEARLGSSNGKEVTITLAAGESEQGDTDIIRYSNLNEKVYKEVINELYTYVEESFEYVRDRV